MQLKFATGVYARIIEWGVSFDGSAAATPGMVELVETGTVFCTISSAFAAADVQPYGDPNAVANTAGTSGVPLNLGTSASGFATAAGTEGSITTSRQAGGGLIAPTNQYEKQMPLSREFECVPGNALRLRVTFATTVNMFAYVLFET